MPAAGAGTMSNTTFGTSTWTYYETIGGGQGASPDADGPSAVHVAMSNALNTPVEALELAYPLRVETYALRLGSGGDGRHRGGDGVVREIRVLRGAAASPSSATGAATLLPEPGEGTPGRPVAPTSTTSRSRARTHGRSHRATSSAPRPPAAAASGSPRATV